MPAYTFEALSAEGQTEKGLLEADTARAARSLLRSRGLVPLKVEPAVAAAGADEARAGASSWSSSPLGWQPRALAGAKLAVWARQLAGLVGAGLPLERALGALADESEEPAQQRLMASLRAEVNAGASFATALAAHPREFSPVLVAVVAAGEQSGQLAAVLESLAADLEARQTLKAKLIGASLYPAIVSAIAVLIVIFLMSYVVPQVANVFVGSKQGLPVLTAAMLATSDALRHWGWLALLALVAGLAATLLARRHPALRRAQDAAWLRLPLLGRLSRAYHSARFAATLGLLTGAGVPILKALQTAADTLGNAHLRECAQQALVLVREGSPLALALAQGKAFASLLPVFARLGEQTGQLPLMLRRAAQQLSQDVQRRALALATLLEPLLIVAMGAVVMLIVLAVLLPIIQLNQLVR